MTDLDTALDEADFQTKTELICLKGSLNSEWEEAEVAAARAHDEFNGAVDRGESTAPYAARRAEALAAFEEVDARLKAASVAFTLSGVEEAIWKATQLRHPPREGQQLDAYLGYDRDAARAGPHPRGARRPDARRPAVGAAAQEDERGPAGAAVPGRAQAERGAGRASPFLVRRLRSDAGIRRDVECARALGISPRRFWGWRPRVPPTTSSGTSSPAT
jgi:hypothetical protein